MYMDRWGLWAKSIRAAVTMYYLLGTLSAVLFFLAPIVTPFWPFGWFWLAVMQGCLAVLAAYYTLTAVVLTKTIYDELLRQKIAHV